MYIRYTLFWDFKQHRFVVCYWIFWDCFILEPGPIHCPATSGQTINLRCIKSRNSTDCNILLQQTLHIFFKYKLPLNIYLFTYLFIYYAYFHSAMSYGIIFWGNTSYSSIIFRIQKKAIRIMKGCGNRILCGNLFQKLQIWPLTSQNILSWLMFVVQNKNFFPTNNENHNLDTWQRNNLYLPQANLTIYQKAAYYSGIKIFNNLPLEIKNVAGNKKIIASKKFLYTYSFYTMEEYLSQLWVKCFITRSLLQWYTDVRFYVHYISTVGLFLSSV